MMTLTSRTMAALWALTLVAPVFAQLDPADIGRKSRGDYESFHQGSAYHRHAQDHSQLIYSYQQIQPTAPVAIVEKQNSALKDNLTQSGEALKALKATHVKDPEVVKLVDAILKRQASAMTHCDMLAACCKKGDGAEKISSCCVGMYEELDAANKDLGALKKHLKIKDLPVPAKQTPTK